MDPELLGLARRRVYVDLDPAFTQLWQEVQAIDMRFAEHDSFVTVGLAVGDQACPVPTCGLDWITTLPPAVLEEWPIASAPARAEMTTVTHWRGYGSIEHDGVQYGQKAHSLRQLLSLPQVTPQPFLLAVDIDAGDASDIEALATNGWRTIAPSSVADTPDTYRAFVQGSRGELGVAKSGYVVSRCGWFSDRSACYLASGRPVVAQETGFSRYLPTGKGLLAFDSVDSAAAAIEAVNSDYAGHARAAREIAETYLDSRVVLSRLLEQVGAS
jgi:hypothetical protein